MKNPFYLVLNGGEAVGKGTQKEILLTLYENTVQVREPGGTPEAEKIRTVLLDKDISIQERVQVINELLRQDEIAVLTQKYLKIAQKELMQNEMNGKVEAYLYAASRSESNANVVVPAKLKKKMIIGDRSVACSMAYQGKARGLGMDFIWGINEPAIKGAMPDLEIFLNLPLEKAQERLKGRTEKQDRLDLESLDFHERVREGYMEFYENYCPYPFVIIDASGTIEEVHEKIRETVERYQK